MKDLEITLSTIMEYEEWISGFNKYLQNDNMRNIYYNNENPITFQDINIRGQDLSYATGGYNIHINGSSFDGFYNYLVQKMQLQKEKNINSVKIDIVKLPKPNKPSSVPGSGWGKQS